MKSNTKVKVLIAIIAYNEQGSIQAVINEVSSITYDKNFMVQIVVFDDCSTDRTVEISRNNNLEVVSHPWGSGNGMFTISTYLKFAYEENFDIAVQIDGDNQHIATYIPLLCSELISRKDNIIIGSRYLLKKRFAQLRNSLSHFDRIIGNYMIATLLRNVLRLEITDSTSGMRAYDRKAILSLKDSSIDAFDNLTFYNIVKGKNLKVSECPVTMRERKAGSSEFTFLKKIVYVPSLFFSIIYTLINRR